MWRTSEEQVKSTSRQEQIKNKRRLIKDDLRREEQVKYKWRTSEDTLR